MPSMTRGLQFWISGVNNVPWINILDKVESIITQNSITFTELEDCMHESLRLCMSGVFHDQKFTSLNKWRQQRYQYQHSWRSEVTYILKSIILNEWSRQWSLYQHSRQSGVNFNSKFYNIDWVRGLQARISTIMKECFLQWPKFYNLE